MHAWYCARHIRQVGDWKSGRISQQQLEAYLDRRTLIFDRELLAKMFVEADYQKEGSLDTRALAIAISGRFPKRELTEDWRKLTALLLGLQELVGGVVWCGRGVGAGVGWARWTREG